MTVPARFTRIVRRFAHNDRGSYAVEFAFVAPPFLLLTVGIINLSLMMLTQSSLHYASEAAARCASVETTVCTDGTAIEGAALAAYQGPAVDPTFTYEVAACGKRVSGTATYVLNAGVAQWSVPLSATACFP